MFLEVRSWGKTLKSENNESVLVEGGFPAGASSKEPVCQSRRHERCGFSPWVGTIPLKGAWQPTPGESHGQRGTVYRVAKSWTWLKWISTCNTLAEVIWEPGHARKGHTLGKLWRSINMLGKFLQSQRKGWTADKCSLFGVPGDGWVTSSSSDVTVTAQDSIQGELRARATGTDKDHQEGRVLSNTDTEEQSWQLRGSPWDF